MPIMPPMSTTSPAHRTLTGPTAGPHLLITAGVHGDEFEPMAAVRQLLRVIDASRLRGRVTLVPVVNEPAFRRGARTADDNLDLARTCPGRADGSITERIAAALSTLIRSADYYIDLHTGGLALELVPLAGYTLHADAAVLEVQRRMARAFNLPLVWGTSPNLEGRSLSVARDARVPAIYVEHGGGGPCDPAKVDDLVAGCMGVLADLGMLDWATTKPPSRVRHVVEDARDQSGHLQINYPSPRDGFFEPAVRLGQTIEAGETIGTVSDALGDAVAVVPAVESGMIVMLRAFRSVRQTDPLAAIVATAQT
jgi:predicted deacylase